MFNSQRFNPDVELDTDQVYDHRQYYRHEAEHLEAALGVAFTYSLMVLLTALALLMLIAALRPRTYR